jgi:hypothetical protein
VIAFSAEADRPIAPIETAAVIGPLLIYQFQREAFRDHADRYLAEIAVFAARQRSAEAI